MALYGGMIYTYKGDVAKKEGKECKKPEGKEEDAGGAGAGKGASGGASSDGVGTPSSGPSASTPTAAAPGSGSGSSSGSTEGGKTPETAASTSTKTQTAPTSPTVTVTTISGSCVGLAESKGSDGAVTDVSYVAHDTFSLSVKSQTDSFQSIGDGTFPVTTAIVACETADVEISSDSNGNGSSRVTVHRCIGIAAKKCSKGITLMIRRTTKIKISLPSSTGSSK